MIRVAPKNETTRHFTGSSDGDPIEESYENIKQHMAEHYEGNQKERITAINAIIKQQQQHYQLQHQQEEETHKEQQEQYQGTEENKERQDQRTPQPRSPAPPPIIQPVETITPRRNRMIRRKEGTHYVEEEEEDEEGWVVQHLDEKPSIPFWFGNELPFQIENTCRAYATYLQLGHHIYNKCQCVGQEVKRAPKSYIGYINRIIIHGDIQYDDIAKPYAIKHEDDVDDDDEDHFHQEDEEEEEEEEDDGEVMEGRRSPVITFEYDFAVSPTHREHLLNKFPDLEDLAGVPVCTSIDKIHVFSKSDSHLGSVLTPDSTHYCTTQWNADGDPIEIRGLRKERYHRFLNVYEDIYRSSIESDDDYNALESTCTCEPYFEGKSKFKYESVAGYKHDMHTYAGLQCHLVAEEAQNMLKHRQQHVPQYCLKKGSERPKSSGTPTKKSPPRQLKTLVVSNQRASSSTLSPVDHHLLSLVNDNHSPVYSGLSPFDDDEEEEEEEEPLVLIPASNNAFFNDDAMSSDAESDDDDSSCSSSSSDDDVC